MKTIMCLVDITILTFNVVFLPCLVLVSTNMIEHRIWLPNSTAPVRFKCNGVASHLSINHEKFIPSAFQSSCQVCSPSNHLYRVRLGNSTFDFQSYIRAAASPLLWHYDNSRNSNVDDQVVSPLRDELDIHGSSLCARLPDLS